MKIFLLGDNHAYLGPELIHHAQKADEIWHTGDWLNMELLEEFEKLGKKIRSVWGNVDPHSIRNIFPLHDNFQIQGIKFWMTHIGGAPPRYNPKLLPTMKQHTPDVFICGHSHILRVERDAKMNNMLYINPGACGTTGFHRMRTAVTFEIREGKIENMMVLEFGPRAMRLE